MLDGAELTRSLISHRGDHETALTAYEKELFARSCPVTHLSASNLASFFGPGAPMSVVDLFADG
jgi:hypothetical protein